MPEGWDFAHDLLCSLSKKGGHKKGDIMYGRTTQFKIKPDDLETVVGKIPEIRKHVQTIPGMVYDYVMWNEDGAGTTVAIYESKAASDAAEEHISAIWGGLAPFLAAPPISTKFETVEDLKN